MRDAALAVSLGALVGRRELAERYLRFATEHVFDRGDPCPCPVVAVDGERVPDERVVDGVAGWAASTPVRVGNAAREQVQYDAWGLLCDAAWVLHRAGGDVTPKTRALVARLADAVSAAGREPTHGIWELRRPSDLVAADIGRWLVLDRALRFARLGAPWARQSRQARRWRAARREARERVLAAVGADGFVPQTYEQGDARVDASALMVVVHGLLRRRDPRARRVVEHTVRALEEGPWLRRYVPPVDDDFAGTEGAFVPASWWAVEALAALGDVEAAQRRADDLCARSPRLVSEEVDAATDVMLGNTPLVWSHVGMARALYAIDAARRRRRYGAAGDVAWNLRVRLGGRWRRR
jgi:GH15 family glucan-1,4-alpha-glucosidase